MKITHWLVALLIAGIVGIAGVGYYAGYRVAENDASDEQAYCEAPVAENKDCSEYVDAIEEWVTQYEECEDKWLQVQRDLARCQNYKNSDCMCTDGTCR